MAWRFVRQPNGLLARYSDVIDDFTHYNLERSHALGLAREELGRVQADAKVASAERDELPLHLLADLEDVPVGQKRLMHCLRHIVIIKGIDHLRDELKDMGIEISEQAWRDLEILHAQVQVERAAEEP